MKQRCLNPRQKKWHLYGGRGIRICDRWKNDFAAFLADMGERLTPKHSIDRIDNDGNYEPANCRWATFKEQANNRRKHSQHSKRIFHEGKALTELAIEAGLNPSTVWRRYRVGRRGADLFLPDLRKAKKITGEVVRRR